MERSSFVQGNKPVCIRVRPTGTEPLVQWLIAPLLRYEATPLSDRGRAHCKCRYRGKWNGNTDTFYIQNILRLRILGNLGGSLCTVDAE